MPELQPVNIAWPIKGLNKADGLILQEEGSTASCMNVWPRHYPGGRGRGGTRPGTVETGNAPAGTPLNSVAASFGDGTRGTVVTTTSGAFSSPNGVGWTNEGLGSVVGDFATATVFLNAVFLADAGLSVVKYKRFQGSGGTLGQEPDEFGQGITPEGTNAVPVNCGLCSVHADRLVLAGDINNPHLLYMSAIGNPNGWDFFDSSQSEAWANSGGEEGKVSEPITSLVRHNKQCLIIGCTDSFWIVRGNPRVGGDNVEQLSHEVGPLMQSAWCHIGSEHTVFMSRQGLMSVAPGCGVPPKAMSDDALPDEMQGIDPSRLSTYNGDRVGLAYDARFRMIHIYIRRGSDRAQYAYDILKGGYWPMSIPGNPDIPVAIKPISSLNRGSVISMGNGSARFFDSSVNETMDTHVLLGPIALGSPHTEGILTEIAIVLAEITGDVGWRLYTGDSPYQAHQNFLNNEPSFTGTAWKNQGLRQRQWPRSRGVAAFLEIYTTGANTKWSVEEVIGRAYQRRARKVSVS